MAAFRATLEEVNSADLVVHVRDISHPDSEAQRDDVEQVLTDIGARGEDSAPMIEVWNKIDQLSAEARDVLRAEAARRDNVVLVSALTGEGTDDLAQACSAKLTSAHRIRHLDLPLAQGAAIAWIHAHGEVVTQEADDAQMHLAVRLSDEDYARFQSRFG